MPYFTHSITKVAWIKKFSDDQTKATCLESDPDYLRVLHFGFYRAGSTLRSISRMFVVQKLSRLTMLSNMASTQNRFGGSLSAGVTSMHFG
jgi:hypothetical protein